MKTFRHQRTETNNNQTAEIYTFQQMNAISNIQWESHFISAIGATDYFVWKRTLTT